MPVHKLTAVWAGLDFALFAAGIISIVFSIVWKHSSLIMNFTLFEMNLAVGTVLGVMFEVSVLVSLFAITQRKPLTSGLKALNWTLVLDSIAVLVVGSILWFYSLRQPTNYLRVWEAQPDSILFQLQDKYSCCGWNNGTNIALGGSFCGTDNSTAATKIGCETLVTHDTDYALNNIFTSIYGFMAISLSFMLITVCQINKRVEEDRFRRIDEKRGGRGFV